MEREGGSEGERKTVRDGEREERKNDGERKTDMERDREGERI